MTENRPHRALIPLSNLPQTREAASKLVAIAIQHRDDYALAAAATLALSAVLEQAVFRSLFLMRRVEAWDNDIHQDGTSAGIVVQRDLPFRERLERTVQIASENRFRVIHDSRTVRRLKSLIRRRNELLHIKEEPVEVEVTFSDERAASVKIPENKVIPSPWATRDSITVAEYQSAVWAYVDWLDSPKEAEFVVAAP